MSAADDPHVARVRREISSSASSSRRSKYADATSATSESSTPRRPSSVARYCARAASFSRRMRPQTSSSQAKRAFAVTWFPVTFAGVAYADVWARLSPAEIPASG